MGTLAAVHVHVQDPQVLRKILRQTIIVDCIHQKVEWEMLVGMQTNRSDDVSKAFISPNDLRASHLLIVFLLRRTRVLTHLL